MKKRPFWVRREKVLIIKNLKRFGIRAAPPPALASSSRGCLCSVAEKKEQSHTLTRHPGEETLYLHIKTHRLIKDI